MKKTILYILIILAVLSIVSLIMGIWLGILQSFRIVFGVLYIMFLPGFIWSYVFFCRSRLGADFNADMALKKDGKDGIDIVERIILSIALSIALVPLTIFLLNKIGVQINLWSTFFEILGLIILGIIVSIIKLKYKINKNT